MDEIVPRYEFRAFAQSFGLVEKKMRQLAPCEMIRESSEVYIVSAGTSLSNTKIRHNVMDIKVLVREEQGLEQWRPSLKAEFPLAADVIRQEVFPAFAVSVPELVRPAYTLDQLVEEIVRPHPQLTAAQVFKRRSGFMVSGCIAEIAELLINGAAIKTAAVESEDVEAVVKAKEMLGLQEYENVNYLLAIKRVIGMEPLPSLRPRLQGAG